MNQEQWNREFVYACQFGMLERIKELVGKEYEGMMNLHANDDFGFRIACLSSSLEVVKWFLFEQEYEPSGGILKRYNNQGKNYDNVEWHEWLRLEECKEIIRMVKVRQEARELKGAIRNILKQEGVDKKEGDKQKQRKTKRLEKKMKRL